MSPTSCFRAEIRQISICLVEQSFLSGAMVSTILFQEILWFCLPLPGALA